MNCPDANILQSFLDGRPTNWQGDALEVHLDRCAECRQVLAALATGDSARSAPEANGLESEDTVLESHRIPPTSNLMFAAGDEVDHYKIERLLGRGGMGEVFLARDLNLRRRVAIKVIRPELVGSRDAAERFLLEARAAARLNHPGIVTVYGVGNWRGLPYIALEFVEGETLRTRMNRANLRAAEWLPILHAVADAAAEAHRHGIVHGDLKPANVLLSSDGRVRTVDFGLARVVRDESISFGISGSDASGGGVQGTPSYMAPELWQARPSTPATDVWALCVMLAEVVCGNVPFEPSQVARAMVDPRAVCREVLRSSPDLEQALVELLARGLSAAPDQRPDMRQVARVLKTSEAASRTASHAARSVAPLPERSATAGATLRSARAPWLIVALLVGAATAWGLTRQGGIRGGQAATSASAPGHSAVAQLSAVVPIAGDPTIAPAATVSSVASSPAPVVAAISRPSPLPAPSGRPIAASAALSAPSIPPPMASRLMAVSALEDKAEAADRQARAESDPRRKLTMQSHAAEYRSTADEHVRDIEAIGTQLQATEPANSVALLDYARRAREMLRRRRNARTP